MHSRACSQPEGWSQLRAQPTVTGKSVAMSTACPWRSHLGTRIIPGAKHSLAFARAGRAGLLALQHSQRQPEPSGMHPADFRDRVLGQLSRLAGGTWTIQPTCSTKHRPSLSPYFVLTYLLSLADFHGEEIWFVWLCFFSQQSLEAVEYNTFFCVCADTHGQEPWGQMRCRDLASLMLWGGRVRSPASTPAAVGSWCFYPWKGQMPPKRSFRKWAALCRAQPSSVPTQPCCPGEPLHSFGPATARMNPHTNKSIHSFGEGNNQKRKMGEKQTWPYDICDTLTRTQNGKRSYF